MESIPELIETLRAKLQPWRAYVIAIDGRDGAGKSPLGRLLAFKLRVPLVETDLFLVPEKDELEYRIDCLRSVIDSRLSHNRPVMVECIFMLQLLDDLSIKPDFVIHVTSDGCDGSYVWAEQFSKYESEFDPVRANHQVKWEGQEEPNG